MENLKIVTFNLRTLYDAGDGVNSFIHRAGIILDKINEEKPHIIAFQEVGEKIRPFLEKYLVDYNLVGHGRLADFSSEGLGVAYRKDTMDLFGLEQFWLSPTPQVPGTRYEIQSIYPRTCVYVVVKHKNMKTPIRLYDVHLDHESDQARILGIKQLVNKMKKDNEVIKYPSFLLGDFNAKPGSETISFCDEYKEYPLVDLTKDIGHTYHNFNGEGVDDRATGWKIDYVYSDTETSNKMTKVYKWEDSKNGIYLSDHYPICCEFEME